MFNLNDYEMVEERLKRWWAENPDGMIHTELIESNQQQCIFIAKLFRTEADAHPVTTGWARSIYSVNKQTAEFGIELAETSAIGRALANYTYSGKKRASKEEIIKITKDELAKPKKEYIPVQKEDDPWTIKEVAMPETIDQAVNTVKEIIGEASEIPKCPTCREDMNWRTGTSAKNNKPWANFSCKRAVGSGICNQVIWYEVSPTGKWVPQEKRG